MESHTLHALAYAANFWKGSLRTCVFLGSIASISLLVSPAQAYTMTNPQYGNLSHNVTQTKTQIEHMNQLEKQSQKLSKLLPPMQKPLLKEIARLTLLYSPSSVTINSNELNTAQNSQQQNTPNIEQSQDLAEQNQSSVEQNQKVEKNSSIEHDLSINTDSPDSLQATNKTPSSQINDNESLSTQIDSLATNSQPNLINQSSIAIQPNLTERPLLLIFGADKFYTFLGCANCAPNEALSIWNPYGPYGSHKSQYSIWSDSFEFGNASAQVSPWNPYGRQPPFLIDSTGTVHGRLSLNPNSPNANRGILASFLYQNYKQIRLDPKAWFYELFSNSKHAVLTVPETQTSSQQPIEISEELLPDAVPAVDFN